jgi:hypothetical protein
LGEIGENSFVFTDSGDSDPDRQAFLAKLEFGGRDKGGLSVSYFIWGGHSLAGVADNPGF